MSLAGRNYFRKLEGKSPINHASSTQYKFKYQQSNSAKLRDKAKELDKFMKE